jgi:hypothetical protein
MNGGGYTLERALNEIVMPVIKKDETYKAKLAREAYEAKLEVMKKETDIANTRMDTNVKSAQINKIMADISNDRARTRVAAQNARNAAVAAANAV